MFKPILNPPHFPGSPCDDTCALVEHLFFVLSNFIHDGSIMWETLGMEADPGQLLLEPAVVMRHPTDRSEHCVYFRYEALEAHLEAQGVSGIFRGCALHSLLLRFGFGRKEFLVESKKVRVWFYPLPLTWWMAPDDE